MVTGNKPKSPQHAPPMDHFENIPYAPSYLPPPNPYGMFIPPYPYQFNYGPNIHQPSNDYLEQFGYIPPTNMYGPMINTPDMPQTPLSYPDQPPVNSVPSYSKAVNNQFFPNTKPYDNYDANNISPPDIVNGGYPVQSGPYKQIGPNVEDYKTKTVQQLKDDVSNLHQYIAGLKNGPKYNEGQDMIPRLENQINELQGNV